MDNWFMKKAWIKKSCVILPLIVQDPLERPSMNSCDGRSDGVVHQLEAILQLPNFKEKSEQPIIFFVDGKSK